jgi:hypothetical protein
MRTRLRSGVGYLGERAIEHLHLVVIVGRDMLIVVTFYALLLIRVEKYRPDTLDDVVSHKDITGTSKSSSGTLKFGSSEK